MRDIIPLNHNLLNHDLKEVNHMFYGRKKELEFMNKKYQKNGGQLVILYGRRRIGKTELLREFAKDKKHVFYACNETTNEDQLKRFSARVIGFFKESKFLNGFDSWEESFEYFASIESTEKKLLIIDEFPYMVKGDKSIPSILQNLWDSKLKDLNVMIILCGSSMSFIENELLGEKNPLYGRTTGIYKMKPMDFDEATLFFPEYKMNDLLTVYSILGGIPHYLKQFSDRMTVEENIIEEILIRGNTLFNEVEFLLKQELRETQVYNTLISVIAAGNTKLNDISQKTMMDKAKVGVYLKNLVELGIIEREFPVTEKLKATVNVQRGLYRITDAFFTFWYRFVFPNLSDIEEGEGEYVYRTYVDNELNDFTSRMYEEISIDYLKKLNRKMELPFHFRHIARWWDKNNEIDIVGFDDKNHYLLGECKWRNEQMKLSVFRSLEQKGETFAGQKIYYLFSKSGFSDGLIEEAKNREDLVLVYYD